MNTFRLSPRSAARLTAGMFLAASILTAVAAAVMLILRYSRLQEHVPATSLFPLQIAMTIHIVAAPIFLLVAYVFWRRKTASKTAPRLAVCFLTLCFIGSVDLIVGIFFPPSIGLNSLYHRHIQRGWTNRPNAYARNWKAWMRFDANGLRINEDLSDPDPPGRTHILFVGDSVTLAYNLHARASFAWWTAKMLNDRHPQLDVAALNGGICGYDTGQERNWLEEIGFTLDSELVVLQFCMNDVAGQFDPNRAPTRDQHVESILAEPPNRWSGIQRAICEIRRRMQYNSDQQERARKIEHFGLKEVIGPNPPAHVDTAWKYLLEDLDRIRVETKERGKPLLFVVFPTFDQLADAQDPGRPQTKLTTFAKSKGMHCIDMLPVYRQAMAAGSTPQELFLDETHPSELGHKVAAKRIVEYIEKHHLLAELSAASQATTQTQ